MLSQTQNNRSLKVDRHFSQDQQGVFIVLPTGEMAEDILRGVNQEIVSSQANMEAKKFSELLPSMAARFGFEGGPAPWLLHCNLELSYMTSYKHFQIRQRKLPSFFPRWMRWRLH